jgi:hypothetical protein
VTNGRHKTNPARATSRAISNRQRGSRCAEPTDDRGDADVGHHFEGKRRTKNDTGVAAGQIVRKQGKLQW